MDSEFQFSGRPYNTLEYSSQNGFGTANSFIGFRENSQNTNYHQPINSTNLRPATRFSNLAYSESLVCQKNEVKFPGTNWTQQGHAHVGAPPGFDQFCTNPNLQKSPTTAHHFDATTQTKHDAIKEKLHLCESILNGCDEMKKIIPIAANSTVSQFADNLQENVMSMYLLNNICSQQTPGATEVTIITEYAKSFTRIADCWLETRNCFGLSDRCSALCRLEMSDLTTNYVEWMHSSRRLLSSILSGLQKMNMMYMSDPSVYSGEDETNSEHDGASWSENGTPRPEEVPKFTPKYVPPCIRNRPKNPRMRKYAGQSCPLLPVPPQAFVSEAPTTSEYMKPSSYNVPRNELTQSKKRMNLSVAKTDIVNATKDHGAYIVGLTFAPEPKFDGSNDEGKEKVFQIATKTRSITNETAHESLAVFEKNPSTLNLLEKAIPDYRSAIKKQTLPPSQLSFMSKMVQYFSTCDFPSYLKEKGKSTKYHKSVEFIINNIQNSLYENMEQFIYDCRRCFLSMACKSGKEGQGKIFQIRYHFEDSLRKEFSDYQKWDYITGEMRKILSS